jgi:hypothetical protein
MTTHQWIKSTRPFWAYINPWLYMKRRDFAYAEALDSLQEASITKPN